MKRWWCNLCGFIKGFIVAFLAIFATGWWLLFFLGDEKKVQAAVNSVGKD